MNQKGINIVQLNDYPRDRYNVLIPVTTMQVLSNMQKIVVNEVRLDTTVDDKGNGRDVYREKSSGKYAITKVGGMKLAAAANISIIDTQSSTPDGCRRCTEMAKATGKAANCGACDHRNDVAVTVSIRVPEPTGGFRIIRKSKEIDCALEKLSMTEAQFKRFLPFRAAMAESKAFMRALRDALGLAATYEMAELRKPFIIAHVVPNLDAPEIRNTLAQSYLQSMGMLFEIPASPALPAAQAALPPVDADDDTDDDPVAENMTVPDDMPDDSVPEWLKDDAQDEVICADCSCIIQASGSWTPEAIRDYSVRNFGRVLCPGCQREVKKGARR